MAIDSTHEGHHALIFGASGITGWAIMQACLYYPSPNAFERVIGVTNRSLSKVDSQFPESPRLSLHSGVDLSKVGHVEHKLKGIHGIEKTTHVYFAAYTGHGSDFQGLKRANVEILGNALKAVENLCPNLQFWTLQTGGKGYGVEFPDKIELNPPFKESYPRIPQPYADNIFYYAQYDLMKEHSAGKNWTFVEVRPDAIIGFVPQNNAMNLAQALGLFLSMYASVEGSGAEVPYPGNEVSYEALHTDTSQDILARFHIYASVHPDKVSEKAFNVADGDVVSWEQVWPGVCQYFNLKGVGPDVSHSKKTGTEWMRQHRGDWESWVKKNQLKEGALEATSWEFMGFLMGLATFDRQYDLSAIREVGFADKVNTVAGYHIAFDRMRKAKIIP